MSKVYIAGQIAGDPHYREAFWQAAMRLEVQGFAVLSPAFLPQGMEPADYMAICLAMVSRADVVALLPGWEHSPGARLEADYARYIGTPAAELEQVLQGRVTA